MADWPGEGPLLLALPEITENLALLGLIHFGCLEFYEYDFSPTILLNTLRMIFLPVFQREKDEAQDCLAGDGVCVGDRMVWGPSSLDLP